MRNLESILNFFMYNQNKGVHIMKVNNISSNSPNFGAKINLKSRGIVEYCEYLERCKNAPEGWFSSNRNIALFSKICDAFEKHPSNEVLNTDLIYVRGGFNVHGVAQTSRCRMVDMKPSRSDDGTGPMQCLFRKLLDKDNKKMFNKLMGEEHSSAYDSWWNENISPIKKDIDELYKNEYKHGLLYPKQIVQEKIKSQPIESITEFKEKGNPKKPFLERLKNAWQILKGN